jgi:LPS sulfotransferase NodH
MTPPNGQSAEGPRTLKSYLLCTVPRSGSWLLADLLEQTDLAGRPEEYFRPDHRVQWSKEWGIRPKDPYSGYVRAALANTTTDNGVFGVKTHWYQFEWFADELRALPESDSSASDEAVVEQWLPKPHYIHLYREDTVRQAISYYRATYSDRWFHLAEEDEGGGERFIRPVPMPEKPDWGHVRYLEEAVISHEKRWTDFFARSGIVPLEVRYEDIVLDYRKAVRDVLGFLGAELAPDTALPAPRLKKQADEETERLTQEYLAHRDSVEPRPFNLRDKRVDIVPRPLHDAGVDPVSQPSAP